MEISIRRPTDNDIPIVLELLYELDRPRPIDNNEIRIFKNKIKDYFSDPDKAIFLAELDSKIVGLVSIIILRRLNRAKPEMYIPELVVTQDHRNIGVGSKMIAYCVDFAKKKNCYRIRLESGNTRIDSHIFYKNMGFEQSSLSFTKSVL